MIDKIDIASKNWAEDYMTQHGRRFHNMLRDAFIAGFKKGVQLARKKSEWVYDEERYVFICSECGREELSYDDFFIYDMTHDNFCPNCGCDMRKRKEEVQSDCNKCVRQGSYRCTKCDGEMYFKDELQINYPNGKTEFKYESVNMPIEDE